MKKSKLGLAVAMLLSGLGQAAYAACPADGATPFLAGPIDPTDPADPNYNGFASYLQDSQGLALALCLDPNFCFFDPPIANNPFSVQIGFGAEAFWWLSEATVATAVGLDALVVMAAEAAFVAEVPTDGEQFPFTRLRIRVDVPFPGVYTVTHPYGQESFVVPVTAPGQEIRESFDIEFMPNAQNQGRVGPWLTWDTFPNDPVLPDTAGSDRFVGDAATPHAVKGSPCGNNFFRVEAVGLDGVTPLAIDPLDEDGDGLTNRITTDLFVTSGRVFPGNVATPLVVDAVTYSRDGVGGRVNVFATAPATAQLVFDTTIDGLPTAGAQAMTGDGAGRFFGSLVLGPAAPVPATVEVTATNVAQANNDRITRPANVTDVVSIAQPDGSSGAIYQSGTLTIVATSSDQASPPSLEVLGFGFMTGGTLTVNGLTVAPATVTVQSGAGGSAEEPVRVINP